MAADPNIVSFKLGGLDNLKRTLQALPNNLRRKALTKALRAAGKVVLDEAKARVPVLKTATPYRRAGTVKKAIKIRVSKMDKRQGNVGVFINVKPLTKAQIGKFKASSVKAGGKASGSANPNDPYYWRWLEFGHRIVARSAGQQGGGITSYTQRLRNGKLKSRTAKWSASSITGRRRLATGSVAARPFLKPAADKLEEAKRVFERTVLPEIAALNKGK